MGTDLYHAHDLDVLGDRTRFALRLEAVRVGALTVGWLSYDTEVRVEATAPESAYQVNVACTGSVLTWSGEDRMVASPLRAAVYRADRAHALQGWDRPCRTFGLRIERDFLNRQFGWFAGAPTWGTDYAAQFIIGLREMRHIGLFLYDTHDPKSRQETFDLTRLLIRDNWGDGALLKFHERVKDALDPRGVIAPGKSGIWPEPFRGQSH